MKIRKVPSALALSIALFGSATAVAADNGFTKEDLKKLQIDAFAEEIQTEMEETVLTDLESTMENTQVDIQSNLTAATMQGNTIASEPTISAR